MIVFIYLGFLVVLISLEIGGFFGKDPCLFCGADLAPEIIEANAGITLPDTYQDIFSYTEGFRELVTYVRFSVSPDLVDEFISSTACAKPLIEIKPEAILDSPVDPEWWQPMEAEVISTCVGSADFYHQTIYVDQTLPAETIIYVFSAVY